MSTESIMIASHQIRMKKFIKDLAKKANKPYNKKKINNCSIIKIELRLVEPPTDNDSNITLIYWGGNEYLSEDTINDNGCYPPPNPEPIKKFYSKNDNLNFSFNTSILIQNLSKNIDVYIIRHGEGSHNKFKNERKNKYGEYIGELLNLTRQIPLYGNLWKDAELTENGMTQANNAGKIMAKCITDYTSLNNIQKVYSSDLKRTQQTLINFFRGLNKAGERYNLEKITVIPGAHEIGGANSIKYSDDGFPGILPIAYENTTSYTTNQGHETEVDTVDIIWTKYLEFYDGLTRNDITCNDSSKFKDNFVTQAVLDYISLGVVNLPDTPVDNPDKLEPGVNDSYEAPPPTRARLGGGKKSKIKTHKKPKKVKVTYKNKTKIIPKKYIAGLKGKERKAQIKSIFENTDRPKTSFKEQRSQWIIKFEKKYNQKITDKSWIHKNIITNTGQNKILSKGRGAYYSSGSRPNQTHDSWAYARLASVIMNGPARKYDMKIWNKYKV